MLLHCACTRSVSLVRNRLDFSIFLFELPLHFEVSLALSFLFLVLHVSYHSGMHCGFLGRLCPMHEGNNASCAEESAAECDLRSCGHDWFGLRMNQGI